MNTHAFSNLSRKQRIHRVMSLLHDHVPPKLLAQIDSVFTELYSDLQRYTIKDNDASSRLVDHRADLEAGKSVKFEKLLVNQFVLLESVRIRAARQKLFRLAHSCDPFEASMKFETKKVKSGFHRVTRTA